MKDCRILVVDDEEVILESVRDYFDEWNIVTHSDPRAALEDMRSLRSDVLVCDYRMPHLSGLEVLREARRMDAYRYGILLTAFADKDLLLRAVQEDLVHRVVEKPLRMELLEDTLREAMASCRRDEVSRIELAEIGARYRSSMKGGTALCRDIVGLAGGLAEAYRTLRKAGRTRESILFLGETGTGKEVAARLAHSLSGYADGPFVKINCAAIPETLVDSELFGHSKGAFTGAEADRPGKIELADGGTLFLDEVGELPESVQSRLLQCLQEKTVERVGENRRRSVDFRLLCATNRDIDAEIAGGGFRADLYYRIATIRITIPPLRQRAADIPALARSILEAYCAEIGRPCPRLSREFLDRLMGYQWPGNIRELENELKRAVILADPHDPQLGAESISAGVVPRDFPASPPLESLLAGMGDAIVSRQIGLDGIEAKLLDLLLKRHGGNVLETARRTGIAKDRLYRFLGKGRSAGG